MDFWSQSAAAVLKGFCPLAFCCCSYSVYSTCRCGLWKSDLISYHRHIFKSHIKSVGPCFKTLSQILMLWKHLWQNSFQKSSSMTWQKKKDHLLGYYTNDANISLIFVRLQHESAVKWTMSLSVVYSGFDHDIIITSSIQVELSEIKPPGGICHGSSVFRPKQSTLQCPKLSVAFFCLPGPDRNPLWNHFNTDWHPRGAGPQLQSAGGVSFFLPTRSN